MSSQSEMPADAGDRSYGWHVRTYTPEEILNDVSANPEPWENDGSCVIEDLTDEEWEAFVEAIS